MESQSLKLNQDFFNLHVLIQKAFGLFRHEAKRRNITLIAKVKNENKTHHVFC